MKASAVEILPCRRRLNSSRSAGFCSQLTASTIGSDQCAVHGVEGQQANSRVIARMLDVAAQEFVGEIFAVMPDKVHDQKGDIVHDIDPTQFWIELQAVKRRELSLPTHDIMSVKIAVAFANVAA